jgi:hypothetical protein
MKQALILSLCFLPLAVIWLVMKLTLWFAAISEEQKHVREESRKPHGPYVANPYADLDEEDEEYGSKTDYR